MVAYTATALQGVPLVKSGDDLTRIILDACEQSGVHLQTGDVLVVTSKIVSKAEGRVVYLETVSPGVEAIDYAAKTGKDPRLVELVLRESESVSRAARGVLVVVHRLGFVCANAGIDQSNIEDGDAVALLLPEDPDETAEKLRAALRQQTGADVAVVISDSHGRPFRLGNVGVAIGAAGLPALMDLRGEVDLFGRELKISLLAYADLIASASALVTGEGAEGRPLVHIRGLRFPATFGAASDLNRPIEQDLYR